MRVSYHLLAQAETIRAARFYNLRVPGLGADFLNSLDDSVKTISLDPCRWNTVRKDARRYLMRRFPFAIYYRVVGAELRILAVKHHARHPGFIAGRIGQ